MARLQAHPRAYGFWQRAEAESESPAVFDAVAVIRFYDAYELWGKKGRDLAAMYLFGYCVEVTLKSAYAELVGVSLDSPVLAALAAMPGQPDLRSRDLAALARALFQERRNRNLVKGNLEGILLTHAGRAHSHWKEGIRYRTIQPSAEEVREVAEAAWWFILNRSELVN